MNLMKKLSIGLVAATMSLASHASFMTIEGTGGFTSATSAGGALTINDTTVTDPGADFGKSLSNVAWGTAVNPANGRSNLSLMDEFAQDITTLGVNYMLSTLTHNNQAISGQSTFLTDALITGVLSMTAAFGGPGASDSNLNIPTLFDIDFHETGNSGLMANCNSLGDNDEDGVAGGDEHVHQSVCDDRFDYTVDGGSFPIVLPLTISGIDYYLTVFAATDVLGNNVITSNRFWTQEGASSNVYTFARLTKVPEPASIAILGLGLLGLASSRKRKS